MSEPMMWLLVRGVWETLAMTFVSGFFGFVIGLPVGVLLYVTRPGQIIANAKLYRTVSAIVNIFRSIPFIILLVWMIPFTRVIVGTSIGLQAAIVPLTVGAAPFIARMVENALLEIDRGTVCRLILLHWYKFGPAWRAALSVLQAPLSAGVQCFERFRQGICLTWNSRLA